MEKQLYSTLLSISALHSKATRLYKSGQQYIFLIPMYVLCSATINVEQFRALLAHPLAAVRTLL
jgi:hypothetical protein